MNHVYPKSQNAVFAKIVMSDDIIHDSIECIRMVIADGQQIGDDTLLALERHLRGHYGGSTVYCAQQISPERLSQLVYADYVQGIPRRQIASNYGICTKTVGKILKNSSSRT